MPKKLTLIIKPIMLALLVLLLGTNCEVQEYRVEVRVTDWDYNDYAMWLTIYLEAENTGDLDIKNVTCDLNVEVDGNSIGTKSINFEGTLEPGDKIEKSVLYFNADISNAYSIKAEPENVEADPITDSFGCSNPII